MEENLTATGLTIKCMEREFLLGPTEKSMKASISTTKRKVLEYSVGLTEKYTRVLGLTASKMEKA